MKCKHQFIKLADYSRPKPDTTGAMRTDFIAGIRVLCAECGEMRCIYEDGAVDLRVKDKWIALINPHS